VSSRKKPVLVAHISSIRRLTLANFTNRPTACTFQAHRLRSEPKTVKMGDLE